MKLSFSRGRLLAGAALGAGLAALASAPAQADSTCAFGSTSLGGAAIGVDCTSVNGNGHTEIGGGLSASGTLATAPAVVVFGGAPTNGLTTGYIESTTAGKDVLDISSTVDFSYLGTGSTLVGQAGATGATTLDITAPSVTFNSGNLTALGAGSNALTVTANGGAGSGGINGTVDGNVTSAAGPAIVLTTTNAAGDGAVTLISALGTTIQATGGNAVTLTTAGSGPIDVTLNGTVIGNTNVHAVGPVTNAAGTAINVDLTNAASTSNVTVAADAAVSGTSGIDATNAGTGGLTVTTGTGLVTGTAGSAINADQTNAASASNVLVTVGTGGATGTGADAVAASTAGSGTVTVNSAGPVASTAGAGINAQSNTGAANVNVTGGTVTGTTSGILATSTSGPVTVALTNGADVNATAGNGIDVASSGAKIVNVGAGSVVTGTSDAILATGGSTVTVNNSGTVGTAGGVSVFTDGLTAATINNQTGGVLNGRVDLSGGNDTINNVGTVNFTGANNFLGGTDAINNNAGGTVNVAAGTSFTGLEALNNAGTLAATSGMLFDAGNTAITNTGTFTAGGAIDLGAGTDSIANNAGGTLTFAAGSSLLGVETLTNAGTLTANSGLLFDAGNTAVTNTGTINTAGTLDFGAGTDSLANNGTGVINLTGATTLANLETFTNAGRINLNTFTLTGAGAFTNTGTIDTNGPAGLAGFTSLSNSGTLDLAAGTFTVPAAVFTNTGTILADEGATTITGQTSFANSGTLDLQDGAVGDTLTINSAFVGSGGSTLAVDFNDTTSDLLVINGAASGSTAVDANYIGAGLFNLAGVQVVDATTATAGAFVLGDVTGNTSPIADYSLVQNGGDFFLVSAPNASAFDPLAVTGLVTTMWYQSADEVLAETHKPATTVGMSFWGDVYWSRDKYGDNDGSATIAGTTFDFDNRLKTKRKGLQLGVDYGFGSGRVGATAGYATAKADNDSDLSDVGLKAKGWNLGLYGQFGGITGFHGEFLAKYDKYNGDFNNGVFDGTNVDFHEFGIDGSAGYRFGIGGSANLDASVGLSHVVSKVDDIEAFGASYDIGKITSTRGRAGLRATFGGGLAPYIDGTVYHEFNGDGNIALFDGATTYDLDTNGKATWFRLEGGLSGNDGPGPILAAWADLGDKKGIGLRAGWRLGGRMAEAAPPPPPPVAVAPPPPPPPATQTCPDGSVILATDACPPPPPPPPPPPMPERG